MQLGTWPTRGVWCRAKKDQTKHNPWLLPLLKTSMLENQWYTHTYIYIYICTYTYVFKPKQTPNTQWVSFLFRQETI